MAKAIYFHCSPVQRQIEVNVLDNETKEIFVRTATFENLNNLLCELCAQYNCYTINIKGFKPYTKIIAENIKKKYVSEFEKDNLIINLIK